MILTRHQVTVEANCPFDDTRDVYEVTVETHQLIAVEEILGAISSLTTTPIWQEELTRRLARTDIARNHSKRTWTLEGRARYWDSQQNPGRWHTATTQLELEVA